jgi:hypothetical protein
MMTAATPPSVTIPSGIMSMNEESTPVSVTLVRETAVCVTTVGDMLVRATVVAYLVVRIAAVIG